MDLGISGRKAIVTGGAQGIGRAITEGLATEGVKVAFTSRSAKALEETLEAIGGSSSGHYPLQCEISAEDGPSSVASEIRANFGEPDIVVNNVGHTLNVTDPYCPTAEWRKVFRLNLEVAVELNDEFIPHMKANDWGRILNVSAGASLENSGPVPYCAAKAALTAYTRSMGRILAIESGNVVMSALLPGVIYTEGGHWERVKTRQAIAQHGARGNWGEDTGH